MSETTKTAIGTIIEVTERYVRVESDHPMAAAWQAGLPIKHIGIFRALCDGRKKAHLRTDLGAARYRQLGVRERFKNEEPYRICPKCIEALP